VVLGPEESLIRDSELINVGGLQGAVPMRLVLAAIVSVVLTAPSFALSISSEVERGFRFFKFNSDFELHRLAYKEFQNTHGGDKPSVVQIDDFCS
jgi:hypothetical protein